MSQRQPTILLEQAFGFEVGELVLEQAGASYPDDTNDGSVCAESNEPTCEDEFTGVLADLDAVLDRLAAAELGGLSNRRLLDVIRQLEQRRARLDAAQHRVVAQAQRVAAFLEDGCTGMGPWLRWQLHLDHGEANVRALAAGRLARLPWLADAWQAGVVSTRHVQTVTAAAIPARMEAISEVETSLVQLARSVSPKDVKIALQRIRDVADPDGSDAPAADRPEQRRYLNASVTFDRMVAVEGLLDQLSGEKFLTLLDALATPDPASAPDHERRTPAQRRHDALAEALDRVLALGDLPSRQGRPPQVLLTIDLKNLLDCGCGHGDGARAAGLRFTGDLDPDLATAIAADARITPVLMLGPWRAVGVGRTQRVLPPELRPLLELVHGHCRGPGCDRPITWAQAAHLDDWRLGGDTDLDQTLPLCPGGNGHHVMRDRDGWQAQLDPDTAIVTWTSPDGRTVIRTTPRQWRRPPPALTPDDPDP